MSCGLIYLSCPNLYQHLSLLTSKISQVWSGQAIKSQNSNKINYRNIATIMNCVKQARQWLLFTKLIYVDFDLGLSDWLTNIFADSALRDCSVWNGPAWLLKKRMHYKTVLSYPLPCKYSCLVPNWGKDEVLLLLLTVFSHIAQISFPPPDSKWKIDASCKYLFTITVLCFVWLNAIL